MAEQVGATNGAELHLSALDATFLELEDADPTAHMHIGGVMVFEAGTKGPPKLSTLRDQLGKRLGSLPRYGCRLSRRSAGRIRRASWEPDPGFDIAEHIRRAALPPPGGERELLDWAADYWSARLDRGRPLWDMVLLEGLEGGRWAICTKTHHALVDGVGSIGVADVMLDASRRPRRRSRSAPAVTRHEHHGAVERLYGAAADGMRSGLGLMLHPKRLEQALGHAASMLELLVRDEVIPAPRTGINLPISGSRSYEAVHTELATIKGIKRALGGTVNDAVLAIASGGLRHMFLARGEEPTNALRAMVPVNIRAAGDALGLGNKISSLFVHLPVGEPDALRRHQVVRSEAAELKAGGQAGGGEALVSLTGLAPPVLHSLIGRSLFASRLFNVTITNVPGPQEPRYAFGCRMERLLPLVPLAADHTVGIAVISHDGQMTFGLNGDERAASDLRHLREGIESSLAELKELAMSSEAAP